MKKLLPLLAAVALVATGAGCNNASDANYAPTASGPGRVVFMVRDAGAELSGVTSVMLTVNKVEAHGDAGWIVASSATKQYDLLKLKASGAAELLADANLAPGTYDQVRLNVSKVEVTAKGKTQLAKLPSSALRIVGHVTVESGKTTAVTFDFDLDRSLHLTGNGQFIMAPVVKLEVKDAAGVKIDADEAVKVEGGETETDETVGADENGETHADFELPEKLELDAGGHIKTDIRD